MLQSSSHSCLEDCQSKSVWSKWWLDSYCFEVRYNYVNFHKFHEPVTIKRSIFKRKRVLIYFHQLLISTVSMMVLSSLSVFQPAFAVFDFNVTKYCPRNLQLSKSQQLYDFIVWIGFSINFVHGNLVEKQVQGTSYYIKERNKYKLTRTHNQKEESTNTLHQICAESDNSIV